VIADELRKTYNGGMIVTRLESGQPVVIPSEMIAALGLKPGDDVAIELVGGKVIVAPADNWPDAFVNNFSAFTEWSSRADSEAYDNP
jgi:bifunctional DNA-binding transcriptional regulator/antitoxin component of YhaV-PrlF toxin-antitoxin module